jgi:integrase
VISVASIEKRDGKYLVRWRHLGASRAKTFRSYDAAQTFKRQIEADAATGSGVDPRQGKTTLTDWWKEWDVGRLHLRASTREKNRHLANHYLRAFGRAQLAQITTPDVQAWVGELTLKPSTVAEVYGELKKCLDAAVQARKLRINPCAGVNLPSEHREEMTILSREEIAKLANQIDGQYKALIYFLAYSGLRIGEATALTPADVDLQRGTVRVNKSSVEVAGVLHVQPPKTKAGIRRVPVPGQVLAMLELDGPTVFKTKTGKPVRVNVFRSRFFRPAVHALGLKVRIHDLRHTAVSMWIDERVDLVRLKTWAGHTRSTFTVDQYGHLFHTDNSALMTALDAKVVL